MTAGHPTCSARASRPAIVLAVLGFAAGLAFPAPARSADCIPQGAITATVKSVSDGHSFVMTDGREVRLAAIEVPPLLVPAATSALAARLGGRDVVLSPMSPATDRYGRLNMHAFTAAGDSVTSIETALAAQGLALASLRGDPACLVALKAAESTARRGKLGFWGASEAMTAEHPAAIRASRGGFAVVEGKVVSVRESGGTIYLNFGRRWSEDFTVTILKRNERKFTAAGMVPRQFEGRVVRIRGFVEERGGPWIEAVRPEQIELADGPLANDRRGRTEPGRGRIAR